MQKDKNQEGSGSSQLEHTTIIIQEANPNILFSFKKHEQLSTYQILEEDVGRILRMVGRDLVLPATPALLIANQNQKKGLASHWEGNTEFE
ncbi:hypothetical protein GOBAR_DD11463 [Gossypium barbadense]|nr:hypothetical protein GOBAR_DD11463 [Gossypium barbadense]